MTRAYSKYDSARKKSKFNHDSRRSVCKLVIDNFGVTVEQNTTTAVEWPVAATRVGFAEQVSYGDAADWCAIDGADDELLLLDVGLYRFTSNIGVIANTTNCDWDWALSFSDASDTVRVTSGHEDPCSVGDADGDAGVVPGLAMFEVTASDLGVRLHFRCDKSGGWFQGGSWSEIWLEKVS
jgi:hypothetical protein